MPRGLQMQFLDEVYVGPMNRHPGIEKTRLKLQENAYWQGWSGDVQAYMQRCMCVGHFGMASKENRAHVIQKVLVDLVGPLLSMELLVARLLSTV